MAFGKKKQKVVKQIASIAGILKSQSGQDAIIEIDNLLSPIFYKSPEQLSKEEKVVVFIEELEREINSGGFNQFYYNATGDYFSETVNALEKINSTISLELLKKSSSPFPNAEIPTDREKRQDVLEEIEDDAEELWEDLEQEFCKYEENIYELLIKYITDNIEKFR